MRWTLLSNGGRLLVWRRSLSVRSWYYRILDANSSFRPDVLVRELQLQGNTMDHRREGTVCLFYYFSFSVVLLTSWLCFKMRDRMIPALTIVVMLVITTMTVIVVAVMMNTVVVVDGMMNTEAGAMTIVGKTAATMTGGSKRILSFSILPANS